MGRNVPFLGGYPALERCIVVDPVRHSRALLAKRVAGSGLFKSVVAASSARSALRLLADPNTDACVLAPTMSERTRRRFLEKASQAEGPPCGLLVLSREDSCGRCASMTHVVRRRYPCSASALFEALIDAVVTADTGCGWALVRSQAKKERTAAAPAPEEPPATGKSVR